jgi:hypothetical protein
MFAKARSYSCFNEAYVSFILSVPTTRNTIVVQAKIIGSQKSAKGLQKSTNQSKDKKIEAR